MMFVSFPVVYEDIILGIEWGMALSTVATALAFIVLAVMLRNIRQLALVLANILCAIGTTILIMYPVHIRDQLNSKQKTNRQLALVLANILCAIGTTILIMYPVHTNINT